jgi:mitogen-activated protein kinase kinase
VKRRAPQSTESTVGLLHIGTSRTPPSSARDPARHRPEAESGSSASMNPTSHGAQGPTIQAVSSNSSACARSSASDSDLESSPPGIARLPYSDADLEEISLLGEGTEGIVHKVMDRRNGRVIARKTIPTRDTPMNELLRELNFTFSSGSSVVHRNIIPFYGAYVSPSSSEVKILMEFCEGGSLEAVIKRIRERGGIVGEVVTGKIAEGVSHSPEFHYGTTSTHPSSIVFFLV